MLTAAFRVPFHVSTILFVSLLIKLLRENKRCFLLKEVKDDTTKEEKATESLYDQKIMLSGYP